MLEAEWRQVPQGSLGMGTKEDESSTGCVWAAGLHHVMACSHLVPIVKLMNHFISLIFQFFLGGEGPH